MIVVTGGTGTIGSALLGRLSARGVPRERTTDTVERILGRPPTSFRSFAEDHAARFEVVSPTSSAEGPC